MNTIRNIAKTIGCTYGMLLFVINAIAQSSGSFEMKTTPNVDFTFNTLEKYSNGIIIPHVLEINVTTSGAQWDLYIGTTTTTAGSWNITSSYSNTGISPPPVNLLKARIYNVSNTSETGGGFFPLTDIATPTYIIGSLANDPGIDCDDVSPTGTNEPGSYLDAPECYKFKVDLKIEPGFNYRPGLYNLRVDFIMIEDL